MLKNATLTNAKLKEAVLDGADVSEAEAGKADFSLAEALSEPVNLTKLKAAGATPYYIPGGGSNALGALGYARAAISVVEEARKAGRPFDAVVLCSGSGGTHAGMLTGMRACGDQLLVQSTQHDAPSLCVRIMARDANTHRNPQRHEGARPAGGGGVHPVYLPGAGAGAGGDGRGSHGNYHAIPRGGSSGSKS